MKEKSTPFCFVVGMVIGSEQTLGACLLPKTTLNVMDGEVDRLMQLTKNAICPISCIVPRKVSLGKEKSN